MPYSKNKIAVISDVHSNYEALASVMSHADSQGVNDVWFLGDAVGYGPEPHRCLKLLAETVTRPGAWVLGNHDEVMRYPPNGMGTMNAGTGGTDRHPLQTQMNPITRYIGTSSDTFNAFQKNYEILEVYRERRNFLLSHQVTSRVEPDFFLVHGGLRSGTPTTTYTIDRVNVKDEFRLSIYKITGKTLKKLESEKLPGYILKKLEHMKDREITGEDKFLELLQTSIGGPAMEKYKTGVRKLTFFACKRRFHDPGLRFFLFGHTHHPACFKGINRSGGENLDFVEHRLEKEKEIQLDDGQAWFLNPGSVGQPRDGDPRSSYIILDRDNRTVQLHRIEYNVRATQEQMENYDMPANLIERLSLGR